MSIGANPPAHVLQGTSIAETLKDSSARPTTVDKSAAPIARTGTISFLFRIEDLI